MKYEILNIRRHWYYFAILLIGTSLLVWEIVLFRKTIIDAKILILIIFICGSIAYIIDRAKYKATYRFKYKSSTTQTVYVNTFAWFQNILSWGFIACTLFMASNTFFGKNPIVTKDYEIDNISDMPGADRSKSKSQPLVRIKYNEKIKELVFSNDHLSRMDNYDFVTLKTKKGLFGFDIIVEQSLKELKSKNMISNNKEIGQILKRLKEDMIEFIEPQQTAYKESDVQDCVKIITDYLSNIEQAKSKEEGMIIVENSVILLNALNEKCEYELIETGQREDIAEIIIIAGNLKGFNSRDEDITEEWRDW